MAVRFKGTSEYKEHYKPFQSDINPRTVNPQKEPLTAPAGVIFADKIGGDFEPPLQRKKRTSGPVTSLSSEFYDPRAQKPADEYILLGKNDKFVDNIRYRNRNNAARKSIGDFNFNRDVSPPKIAKTKEYKENLGPMSAPVVDTSKYRKDPPTPLAPREPKSKHASLQFPSTKTSKPNQIRVEDFKKSVPKHQVKDKDIPSTIPATESKTDVKRPSKPRMKTYKKVSVEDKNGIAPQERKETRAPIKAVAEDRVPMTEEKKEINSPPEEAKSEEGDYALKYKAGLGGRFKNPKRLSEYQREFEWKHCIKMSPLLDAEQVIYNSNVNTSPIKPNIVPKVTEYRSQFKPFKMIPVPEDVRPVEQDGHGSDAALPKKSKVKRSKSTGAIDKENKSVEFIPDASQDATLQQAKDKLKSAHGKYRKRTKSEYAMNFQPPWKYDYILGAWKGANPPHIEQVDTDEPIPDPVAGDDAPHKTNWYAEVLELRQKATEYRRRAQGTHFSREHLVQLMAQQAELWDQLSNSSATLSALSLEVMTSDTIPDRPRSSDNDDRLDELDFASKRENGQKTSSPKLEEAQELTKTKTGKSSKQSKPSNSKKAESTEQRQAKKAWTKEFSSSTDPSSRPKFVKDHEGLDELDLEQGSEPQKPSYQTREELLRDIKKRAGKTKFTKQSKLSGKPKRKGSPEERKQAWSTEANPSTERSEGTSPDSLDDEESVQGRIPTPTLRQQGSRNSKVARRHHLDRTTPTVGGAILSSPPNQRKVLSTRPAFGSGYLSQDESDSDTLVEEAVHRPMPVFPNDQSPINKMFNFRKIDASPTFGMPTRDTHFLRDDLASEDQPLDTHYVDSPPKLTFNHGKFVPRRTYDEDDDDDILSVSARSIASSCSLASEVLERAQKRQEDFWGRRNISTS